MLEAISRRARWKTVCLDRGCVLFEEPILEHVPLELKGTTEYEMGLTMSVCMRCRIASSFAVIQASWSSCDISLRVLTCNTVFGRTSFGCYVINVSGSRLDVDMI